MNCKQMRLEIVRPALELIEDLIPWTIEAENLVLGTIAHESRMAEYVKQIRGPALGIAQMEPATHDDIHRNFIQFRTDFILILKHHFGTMESSRLVHDMFYAVIMCRIHYYRRPYALPKNNVVSLAEYWKTHYNTYQGKGTVQQFIDDYEELVR